MARIMRGNNVFAHLRKRRKPVTTYSNHKLTPSPNLLQGHFIVPRRTSSGWPISLTRTLARAGVRHGPRADGGHMDGPACDQRQAPREIAGWSVADHLRAQLCCDALRMALNRRGPVPGLIHHSDRSRQYANGGYGNLISRAKLTQSMSRKGQCLDNAPMESFFSSLKHALVCCQRFKTRAQAKDALFEYIEVFCNCQRRHSAIGYRTPTQNAYRRSLQLYE